MHVHVILKIDVMEREPGSGICLELRANLGFQRAARAGRKEKRHARVYEIARERAVAIDEQHTCCAGRIGLMPLTSTRCSPTRSSGSARARRIAYFVEGAARPIRLAA